VAISNSRLLKMDDGRVTFRYKDYADAHRQKTMTLTADEFLRRFVQHVLPKGFMKIRHYGLLANRPRKEKLKLSRRLLWPVIVAAAVAAVNAAADSSAANGASKIEPAPVQHCPRCGGFRFLRIELPKETDIAISWDRDTS
jgi:hypothetical protein